MAVDQFRNTLGEPFQQMRVPRSSAEDTGWEYAFARRGYVVQVFADADGAVKQWNVIACSRRFRPTLTTKRWAASGETRTGQINVSTPAKIAPDFRVRSQLDVPASSQPSYSERDNVTHASGFRLAMWGIVSSCMSADYPSQPSGVVSGWSCPDVHHHESVRSCPFFGEPDLSQKEFMRRLARERRHWESPINAWAECLLSCDEFGSSLGVAASELKQLTQ